MVWGCITSKGVGPLIKIDGIMRKEDYLKILQDNLPVAIKKSRIRAEKIIFQQDNDPKHTSKIVKKWLDEQRFDILPWPPQSPDMNPIENFWSHLKRQLGTYEQAPKSMRELWERVQFEWYKIPPETVKNYYESMPRRISALKKSKCLWTKY